MTNIPIDLVAAGFKVDGRLMGNGEKRFRLQASDGSAYIRTEAGAEGAWQHAHHHKGVTELYVVERGFMVAADRFGTQSVLKLVHAGDTYVSKIGQDHNIYLFPSAVIHTIKYGLAVGNPERKDDDWYPGLRSFDEETRSMSVTDICRTLGIDCDTFE